MTLKMPKAAKRPLDESSTTDVISLTVKSQVRCPFLLCLISPHFFDFHAPLGFPTWFFLFLFFFFLVL